LHFISSTYNALCLHSFLLQHSHEEAINLFQALVLNRLCLFIVPTILLASAISHCRYHMLPFNFCLFLCLTVVLLLPPFPLRQAPQLGFDRDVWSHFCLFLFLCSVPTMLINEIGALALYKICTLRYAKFC
jgi:hypothetical protein